MIIDFSIENFKSIKNKITLTMEAVGSNKLPKNIIKEGSIRLVKSAGVFGANASGKSNLIYGLFFMWQMITTSHTFTINTKIPRIPYKFDEESATKPSKFEIEFIYNKIRYRYGFSCNEDKIIEEYLYYWPKRKESLIFKRNEKGFTFKTDQSQQETYGNQTIPNVLYVSRATQLGYDKTKPVIEFFLGYIIINIDYPAWHGYTIRKISENPIIKEKIINILKGSDFGGIGDINVKKEKGNVKTITFDSSGKLSEQDSEQEIFNVEFLHKIKDKSIVLNLSEESAGTQKIFDMLGPLFDILETGKVAIIDEIETSLHPSIVKFIIKLFNSRHNKNNAQLIFSSHNTSLLDNELFRKDQLYFCEKKPNASTQLVSLLEFNIRQNLNFEKAYLQGRFGASPFVDETYTD